MKYIMPSLADKCTEYLQTNLNPSNVSSILPTAEKYEEKELVERCWKVIDRQTEAAVKSDGFATIERSLFEALVARDTLGVREVDLFEAVDSWAAKHCQEQGLSTDGETKRKILGELIIKSIRFPVMRKHEEFAAVVIDAKILTPGEIATIFKFFSSTLASPVAFPETKRSGISGDVQRCRRFQSVESGVWNSSVNKGRLDFTVNKDIILHGLCLCGSENKGYNVTLVIKNTNNNSRLSSKSGTFFSKLLQYKSGYYQGFEVLFDPPVNLKKNTKYQIEALISGPASGKGESGSSIVACDGVTFTFSQCSSRSINGTSSEGGQFPEFLLSV